MTKTDNGAEYPASAYAYVPDPQDPSTWKIRLWESPEAKVTVAQLGRAAAAMSSGGFRGEKAEIPAGDVAKVKARIRAEYSKLGTKVDDMPDSVAASDRFFDLTAIALSENPDEITRIPLAAIGTGYKGKQRFTVTRKDIATMAENFRKKANGEVVMDYEHASQYPEMAAGGPVPASGWIVGFDSEPDAKGVAWGEVKFTPRARALIAAGEYKYVSPVINWAARDKATGEPQGATLLSAALTNTPVMDRMPAIALSETGWQALSQQGETTEVAKNNVMCSEHPKTPLLCPKCDADEIGQLSASEHTHGPKVIALSDVKRDGVGRLDISSFSAGEVCSIEVVRALDQQRVALSEVDAAVAGGKIKPADKDHWTKVALSDVDTFRTLTKDMKSVDLSERGHGGPGTGVDELDQINAKLDSAAKEAMKTNPKLRYGDALKIAASENLPLTKRREELNKAAVAARGGKAQ